MSKINRNTIKKIKIEDESNDYSYWKNQTAETRLHTLETIREEYNNWKFNDKQRFHRIYRVIKQE